MHRNLLDEYSPYFKNLIKQSESRSRHYDQLSIELEMSQNACEMLARWLYGHPLCVNNSNADKNLEPLAQLYDLACDANEEGSTQGTELVDACLDGIKQCLAQTSDEVYNPIEVLESLLVKGDKYPGRAVILRELVYGECATDGRTKLWLDQFCGPERGHEYRTEIAEMVCMEFAKKACEQSQNHGGTNSTNTSN